MRDSIERAAVSVGLVSAAGLAAFAALTHGFTVVTSEGARRASVAASAQDVPALWGSDQDGRRSLLLADTARIGRPGRVTIVDFIYTRCTSVCRLLGDNDEQLQAAIQSRHLQDRVRLVTISFDPVRDTTEVLRRYAARMHLDRGVWSLMRPEDASRLPTLLAAFGVVVVAAPMEQFEHNAAFHVLDADGRLARIVDADDPLGALDAALSMAPQR